MKARLIKPVKHNLSSRSSVFTPVSPTSKTVILSAKYPVKFYRIAEFYRIPVSGVLNSVKVVYRFNSQIFQDTPKRQPSQISWYVG